MGDSKLTPDLADTEAAGGAERPPTASGPEWRAELRLADRYVVRRFLGKGGMGQVWVAFDEVLDKEVALKRVRADVVVAGEALESLRREVSLAQTVTHVNVCRIYDLEPIGSDWVIKMEVIGGRSLAAVLEETPALPVERAQRIARQLADGLAAVHAVGVVHRDLKPHNIIIDDSGRTVLMDFGIARTEAPTGETAAGRITGTPEYMAPEQARGEKVDARADLYALGCVLYRMLAGEVPFPAATRVAAMARHLTDPPPDARKKRPEVPAWLARLARELMAKSPAKRPPDAARVRDRLAGPPSRAPRLAAAALALVVVAGGAIAGVTAWHAHVRDRWRPELADLPEEYDTRSRKSLPSPDGTQIAFDTRRNDEVRVIAGPVVAGGQTVTGPAGHHLLNWTHDSRALLVADKHDHLFRFDLGDGRLAPLGLDATGAAECGDTLYTVEPATTICPSCSRLVMHRRDQPPREVVPADEHYYLADLIACDPRTRRVAWTRYDVAGAQDHLFVQAPDAAKPTELRDLGGHQYIKLGSFTDRDTIIVNALDGKTTNVWELPMRSGRARQLGFGGDEFLPTVTSDGRLFFETFRSTSALFAKPEGGPPRQLTFGDERVEWAVPTPDGRAVALTIKRAYAGDQQLVLQPLDDRPEQLVAQIGTLGDLSVASFVGDELYYQTMAPGATRGPLMVWSLRDGRTRKVRDLPDGFLADVSAGYAHLGTDKGALRVPLDGGAATIEAPKPWNTLYEAPRGGWRLAIRWDKAPSFALFAPGAPLDGAPQLTLERYPRFAADGSAVVFPRGGVIVRRQLATGDERIVAEPGEVELVVESADGKTLFYTKVEQYLRRQVMTNFADRPPL